MAKHFGNLLYLWHSHQVFPVFEFLLNLYRNPNLSKSSLVPRWLTKTASSRSRSSGKLKIFVRISRFQYFGWPFHRLEEVHSGTIYLMITNVKWTTLFIIILDRNRMVMISMPTNNRRSLCNSFAQTFELIIFITLPPNFPTCFWLIVDFVQES